MKKILTILVFFAISYYSYAQPACERMIKQIESFNDKLDKRTLRKAKLDEGDINYILSVYKDACSEISRLATNATDKDLMLLSRFSRINMANTMALAVIKFDSPAIYQTVYDELCAVKEMAISTDIDMLSKTLFIHCTKPDGSYYVFNYKEYAPMALQFYSSFMYACYQLEKRSDAEMIYDHCKKTDFATANTSSVRYVIPAILLHWKIERHETDASVFNMCTYLLNLYNKEYSYDSTILPLPSVMQALNNPLLADTTIDYRSTGFYSIYVESKRHSDKFFTPEFSSNIFKQAMRCLTLQWGCGGLIEDMKYRNPPEIDSIITMNDPLLLQKIITVSENYIQRSGKLKAPFFWKNLAVLYRKAGNDNAAEDAEKNYEKSKIK